MVYIATYTEKNCISFSKISLRIVKVCYKNTTLNRTEL